ncbi:unnamed protein product, partial [Bubo scandiacus]
VQWALGWCGWDEVTSSVPRQNGSDEHLPSQCMRSQLPESAHQHSNIHSSRDGCNYILYMLAKQCEQIQPDFSGALSSRGLRSQTNTMNNKCLGLVESRTSPEHWACLEMTFTSSHIADRQMNALKLKRDELQHYWTQTGTVENGKDKEKCSLGMHLFSQTLWKPPEGQGRAQQLKRFLLAKKPPYISVLLLITCLLVSLHASSCGSMEFPNGPSGILQAIFPLISQIKILECFCVHGGEGKPQRTQVMDFKTCTCMS